MPLRLLTFGRLALAQEGSANIGEGRRKPLAVLALLASAGEQGMSRDRLLAYLWPESDQNRARGVLKQTLYSLRRDLNAEDLLLGTNDLRLNPAVIGSDLQEFSLALTRGEPARAVALYHGPFLDGIFLPNAAEFEHWLDEQRDRLSRQYGTALEALALQASAAGTHRTAVEWWQRLVDADPFDGRAVRGLLHALLASGDRTRALKQAQRHERMLREELNLSPDAEVRALVEEMRSPASNGGAGRPSSTPATYPSAPSVGGGTTEPYVVATFEPATAGQVRRGVARSRLFASLMAAVFVVMALAGAAILKRRGATTQGTLDATAVAVFPFHLLSRRDDTAGLQSGMAEFVAVDIGEGPGLHAVDPTLVQRQWRRAGGSDSAMMPVAAAIGLGRDLGAGFVVSGNAYSQDGWLNLSATLIEVSSGAVRASAKADGPGSGVNEVVEELVSELLAGQAGLELPASSDLRSTPLAALKNYIHGQQLRRSGQTEAAAAAFEAALEADSAFAQAALALVGTTGWIGPTDARTAALARAWSLRARLGPSDRTVLQALAGPDYPLSSSLRDRYTALERAVALASDRGELWLELGDLLLHGGAILAQSDPLARAAAAFRRAIEVDSANTTAIAHLVPALAAEGDIASLAELQRLVPRTRNAGELGPYLRWRIALALGQDDVARQLSDALDTLPSATLRQVAATALFDGVGGEDAGRAVAILQRRAGSSDARAEFLAARHALALLRGQPLSALAATADLGGAMPDREHLRLRVLDGLYGDGDSAAAAQAVMSLRPGANPTDSAPESRLDDACVAAQWDLWHHQVRSVDRELVRARAKSDGKSGVQPAANGSGCAVLIAALQSAVLHTSGASLKAARLDSLLGASQAAAWSSYGSILAARIHALIGDTASAYRSVRRRVYLAGWPPYQASSFVLEARLARSLGDTTAARQAYRRYLEARRIPDPSLLPLVRQVQVEADSLQPRGSALARMAN